MDKTFLEKVAELFIENGAKTLTMDDIAKEFGMSKKTLYQKYSNKEALLEDVLEYKLTEVIEKLSELDYQIENAVERMYCRDEQIEKAARSNNSLLIRQLLKYYPAIFNKHMMNFSERFSSVLVQNIKRGREQGFYRMDFDADLYASIYFQMVMSYDSSPFLDTTKTDRTEYSNVALNFYMNAITTELGKQQLIKYNNLK
ncbi:TetR/AcrR family transcriptional regulator [Marnyiella aurantia]|uniref:TetR/AcrR family transcriptional regulator n=1 Tax=Marnyiella aurantia TaxID=2758037 RepID=A0A7D7LQU6_9FLAO|nr:TetR/AcrR family transcriptional regulator [Marnyiella aurantia]MBA5247336.1 TetR/AcrR family transcriptional regulator [Marnyiella aurantia]QMS99096.1 TetR/AcrR family transcriptional regulator [Marnyiella aurantia]